MSQSRLSAFLTASSNIMAEDNRIFGDDDKTRNAFFNLLGDLDSEQENKNRVIRLHTEFMGSDYLLYMPMMCQILPSRQSFGGYQH